MELVAGRSDGAGRFAVGLDLGMLEASLASILV